MLSAVVSTPFEEWFSRTSRAPRLVLLGRIKERHGFMSMVLVPVSSALLSFIPRSLKVIRVVSTLHRVLIEVVPRSASAECSVCRNLSRRVHSTYRRLLHDLPWLGRPVTLRVAARRFHCVNRHCTRRTFAERLMDVARPATRLHSSSETSEGYGLRAGVIHHDCTRPAQKYITPSRCPICLRRASVKSRPLLSSKATALRLNAGAKFYSTCSSFNFPLPVERIGSVHRCEGRSLFPPFRTVADPLLFFGYHCTWVPTPKSCD
ncbi:transposase family protein [Acidisoma cladoniae]|jgi:hypothetical protein|uniref:transposase family protein n=1 Tax=Acidisoma cladoniae TaxID=3040935 RepID=UPI003D9CBD68